MLFRSHKLIKDHVRGLNSMYIQPTYDRVGTISDKGSPLLPYRLEYSSRDQKLPSTLLV